MEDLDFTGADRPSKSAIYDPSVARMCFEALGKVELVPQGGNFFTENQTSDRMYYLVEGEVSLTRGKRVLDVVKAGEIFGEMATISRLPRSATAAARSACRALSLDTKQFQSAIQKTAPEFALMLMNIIINRLRLTGALTVGKAPQDVGGLRERVFDEKMLSALMAALNHRSPAHAPLNKVIMKEGEGGVFMYVVVEGRVAISIKSRIVERVGPGGIFGEMALVDQSPRAATATAESDCSLLSINRNDFLALVKSHPDFAVSLLKSAADRLRYMTSHHK
jgi:CRP-like cAMP-binding protein